MSGDNLVLSTAFTGGKTTNNSAGSHISDEGTQILHFELQLVRWLDLVGYDVTYTTNVDISRPYNIVLIRPLFGPVNDS